MSQFALRAAVPVLVSFLFWGNSCQQNTNEPVASQVTKSSGPALFETMTAAQTGIDFANTLNETKEVNYMNFNYLYMSGGVGVGDFNKDGLQDLYVAATTAANKLYINQGNFHFEDRAAEAGVRCAQGVKTGVSVVDINNDGWLDIYQCRTGNTPESRGNLLFINNGPSNGGKQVTFTESAAQYGLDAHCPSTHANFFDYDHDGDLDMYLLNHRTDFDKTFDIRVINDGEKLIRITKPENEWSSDRLYRNEGTGKFTDVSQKAGIVKYAYGLSATILDANNDGWPDVFVANDYLEPDNLFINNKNGTFSDHINAYIRHMSNFSMGSDVGDINNDGLLDMVVLDMAPDGNRRQKITATTMVTERYNTIVSYGYGHQMMRNMLQLNNGNGTYSEIGCLAGISETDWSWAPLLMDFDNDGFRDLFVSNGQRRDVTNLDYMNFTLDSVMKADGSIADAMSYTSQIPSEELHSYMYRNRGDLSFEDVTQAWGMDAKTLSNSAVYADLDNDGDMDVVVVNSEKPMFVYRNKTMETGSGNYLQVQLEGSAKNTGGVGAMLLLEAGGQHQIADASPMRGFISTSSNVIHFGLGKAAVAEKLHIQWPDGKVQTLENIAANQRLKVRYADAKPGPPILKALTPTAKPGFIDLTQQAHIAYRHQENKFIDFNRERLMPHSFSNAGPCLAVGDVNADGLDDFYTGGSFKKIGGLFLQQKNGQFTATSAAPFVQDTAYEDTDALFFDADGDQDLDLFVVSGGNEAPLNSRYYQDRLYLNDGKGNLKIMPASMPAESESGSCVASFDYDGDGDLDLFVGGRVVPGIYPRLPYSFVLQNNGGVFTNVSTSVAPEFNQAGLVTAILFADLDKDGQAEMLVTGEWMPIEVFKNKAGKFVRVTKDFGLENTNGWWNSLAASDLDGDGDLDLVAGNLGLNTRYRASIPEPLCMWAKDFDNNGSLDPLMGWYENGVCYPVAFHDPLLKQLPSLKKKFVRYAAYSIATIEDVYPKDQLADAQKLIANELRSCWFENKEGKFIAHPLPNAAQTSPVKTILLADFDRNGQPDILLAGNDYGLETETGRIDAGNGTLLLNDGQGGWRVVPNRESGFWATKEARKMRLLHLANGKEAVLVANNNDALQLFGRN